MNSALSKNSSTFLDLVRLVSAELVLVGHTSFFVYPNIEKPFFTILGQFGVICFFLISGILISHSVFTKWNNSSYSFKSYFVDRFSRIYSGLVPSLIVIWILGASTYLTNPEHYIRFFGNISSLNFGNFLTNLFMLQGSKSFIPIEYNWFGDSFPLSTLSQEWWLYMTFGLIAFQIRSKKSFMNRWFIFILGLVSLIPIYRTFIVGEVLIIAWFFGVGIILILNSKIITKIVPSEILVLIIPILLLRIYVDSVKFIKVPEFYLYIDIAIVVLFASIFLMILRYLNCATVSLKIPLIRRMADYSYTLFIIHFSILNFIFSSIRFSNIMITTITAIIVANLIAYMVAVPTEMKHKQLSKYIKKKFNL